MVLGCENFTIKVSGTVETHDTYNLINSKLPANSASVKSSDFFDVQCFKASTHIEAEIPCAHVKLWNGLVWKGLYRSSYSNPPAMGTDIFH